MKLSKFQWVCIIGLVMLILIAYIDIIGVNLIGYEKYTSGQFDNSVWIHFRNTAIILMLIPSILYYLFKKDKSEALAIFLIPFIGFYFLISDIFYFWLQGKMVPETLAHLNNHIIAGEIMNFLGYQIVTKEIVFITAFLGLIIIYFTAKLLKEKF